MSAPPAQLRLAELLKQVEAEIMHDTSSITTEEESNESLSQSQGDGDGNGNENAMTLAPVGQKRKRSMQKGTQWIQRHPSNAILMWPWSTTDNAPEKANKITYVLNIFMASEMKKSAAVVGRDEVVCLKKVQEFVEEVVGVLVDQLDEILYVGYSKPRSCGHCLDS